MTPELCIDTQNPRPIWRRIEEGITEAYQGLVGAGQVEVRRGEGTFVAEAPLGVDLLRVDLRDGDVTAIGRDLRTPRTIRGNRFATLYLDASGRLLRLDLESGELRPLTGNG